VPFGSVVEVGGTDVLEVAPATVVVVVDVVVVVLEVVAVVGGGGTVPVVVVVDAEDTPLITPPTVVPESAPPKIDERERPALTSTRVTTPSARANAATAEAVATRDKRQRRWAVARSSR
jgi:hypothetical protein